MFSKRWKRRKGRLKDPFKTRVAGLCLWQESLKQQKNWQPQSAPCVALRAGAGLAPGAPSPGILVWTAWSALCAGWRWLSQVLVISPRQSPFQRKADALMTICYWEGKMCPWVGAQHSSMDDMWHLFLLENQEIALWHHAKSNGTHRTTTRGENRLKHDSKRRGQNWGLWVHKPWSSTQTWLNICSADALSNCERIMKPARKPSFLHQGDFRIGSLL